MSILETLNSTKLFERYQDEGDIKIFINSVRMMSHNSTESTFTTVRPIVIQRGTTTELNPEFNIVVKESLKYFLTAPLVLPSFSSISSPILSPTRMSSLTF